jgi:hypothetical protein
MPRSQRRVDVERLLATSVAFQHSAHEPSMLSTLLCSGVRMGATIHSAGSWAGASTSLRQSPFAQHLLRWESAALAAANASHWAQNWPQMTLLIAHGRRAERRARMRPGARGMPITGLRRTPVPPTSVQRSCVGPAGPEPGRAQRGRSRAKRCVNETWPKPEQDIDLNPRNIRVRGV